MEELAYREGDLSNLKCNNGAQVRIVLKFDTAITFAVVKNYISFSSDLEA